MGMSWEEIAEARMQEINRLRRVIRECNEEIENMKTGANCDWCVINPDGLKSNATQWQKYLSYLVAWSKDHIGVEFEGCSPACYGEWLDNEATEEKRYDK